jgi:cyclophilin family peptidyl-prolyl cis-trans isomerase
VEGGIGGDYKGANKMKKYYISIKEELKEEKKFYAEELGQKDWKYLKEASELFLIHAYSHLFITPSDTHENFGESDYVIPSTLAEYNSMMGYEVFGDINYVIKYSQFYLNLAVGLEILLKSILLKKSIKINRKLKDGSNNSLDPERTMSFGDIIDKRLEKIFPHLNKTTHEEIKDTLKLINLRRNNIAHCSKKSYDSYAHEYRFSYITLYIYDKFFNGENQELTKLLLKSIERSKVTQSNDFKPLRIKPRSLRKSSYG